MRNEDRISDNHQADHHRRDDGSGKRQEICFQVAKEANKTEVRQAVEKIFGVNVAKVNIMNVNGKTKRMGRYVGKTADYKKAVITLTADSKEIEIFQGL